MKNILIVNTLPVPSGNASVNRFLSYSKELVRLGDSVTVLSSSYSMNNSEGCVSGVKYRCLGRSGNKYISLFLSLKKIICNILTSDYDIVLPITDSLLLIYPLFIVAKIKKIRFITERNEFPFPLMRKGFFNKIWSQFYVSTTYRLYDGLIIMTKPLVRYYSQLIRKGCKLIEIPMTVDLDRFKNIKISDTKYGNYIAYCGDMAGNKDGVPNLIESFSIVHKKNTNIKLLLIGGSSRESDFINIKKQVSNLHLEESVIFLGKVERQEIPHLLKNAKILALARPLSLQSLGGFPTKLGEYLATGNPVVVTAVGDIPLYLNCENSYIVQPNDNYAFANKIFEILDDYDRAIKIGQEGEKLVNTIFNSKKQAVRLFNYFDKEF